jgi:hypothetical protein
MPKPGPQARRLALKLARIFFTMLKTGEGFRAETFAKA